LPNANALSARSIARAATSQTHRVPEHPRIRVRTLARSGSFSLHRAGVIEFERRQVCDFAAFRHTQPNTRLHGRPVCDVACQNEILTSADGLMIALDLDTCVYSTNDAGRIFNPCPTDGGRPMLAAVGDL
jgi:hypothetical protein